jgi:fibronectin type 3 domain-containing protein
MSRWVKALTAALVFGVLAACGGSDSTTPTQTIAVAPVAPTSLSVEPGDEMNTVQWPAVQGATSYNLYWSETTPVTTLSSRITGVVSPYEHTGLANGTLIYYAVTAVNEVGESGLSSMIGAAPVAPVLAAPTTVTATASDSSVTLAWTPVSGADSYTVYWSTTPDPTPGGAGVTRIANIQDTSFTLSGLTNSGHYYFVVTAVGQAGESRSSRPVDAVPHAATPGAPQNVSATSGDGKAVLAWSASSDAASYSIYWAKAAGVVPGAAGVTQIPGLTGTSYTHTGLTNGDTYYYVVAALTTGGASALSTEVSVTPLPTAPPAPLGLTAIAPKDVVEVTVQWYDVTTYPSPDAPIQLGYNLYRGLEPGVATYYKDAARATTFADVTAPFVDTSVEKATTYYYVVTAFVPAMPEVESVPSGEVSATVSRAGGGAGGGGGETDTGFGNNLSFPLVFADGYGLAGAKISGTWPGIGPLATLPEFDYNTGLRPLSTETLAVFPFFDSKTSVSLGGIVYYPQGTASTWQAEWRNNAAGDPLDVIIDWGDALLSKTYTASSMVRIETALKQDATIPAVTDTMTAFKMALLSGSRTTELQGTDMTTYASATRNVFAINARLKIEKISTDGGPDIVVFDKAVYESFGTTTEEGGGEHGGGGGSGGGGMTASKAYAAELNVGGILVYGYNFSLSSATGIPQKSGQYRLTFSLDPEATVGDVKVPNHIKMVNKLDAGATLSEDGLSSSVVITVN